MLRGGMADDGALLVSFHDIILFMRLQEERREPKCCYSKPHCCDLVRIRERPPDQLDDPGLALRSPLEIIFVIAHIYYARLNLYLLKLFRISDLLL